MLINKTLIMAKNDDLMAKIREAQFLEGLENQGKTSDSVILEVKDILGLSKGQSIIAEFEGKVAILNKLQKNFVDVNSLTQRLIDDNLIEGLEITLLNKVESRIADKLKEVYDLEEEDLYEEDK